MRENRTCGSEGGEGVSPSRPLSGKATEPKVMDDFKLRKVGLFALFTMGEATDAPTAARGPVGSNLFDLLTPMTGKPLTQVRGRMNSTPVRS